MHGLLAGDELGYERHRGLISRQHSGSDKHHRKHGRIGDRAFDCAERRGDDECQYHRGGNLRGSDINSDEGKAALHAIYQHGGFYTEGLIGGG